MTASTSVTLSGVSGHPWQGTVIIEGRAYRGLFREHHAAIEGCNQFLRDNHYNTNTLEKNNERD
jgi:hypothetical protein